MSSRFLAISGSRHADRPELPSDSSLACSSDLFGSSLRFAAGILRADSASSISAMGRR